MQTDADWRSLCEEPKKGSVVTVWMEVPVGSIRALCGELVSLAEVDCGPVLVKSDGAGSDVLTSGGDASKIETLVPVACGAFAVELEP